MKYYHLLPGDNSHRIEVKSTHSRLDHLPLVICMGFLNWEDLFVLLKVHPRLKQAVCNSLIKNKELQQKLEPEIKSIRKKINSGIAILFGVPAVVSGLGLWATFLSWGCGVPPSILRDMACSSGVTYFVTAAFHVYFVFKRPISSRKTIICLSKYLPFLFSRDTRTRVRDITSFWGTTVEQKTGASEVSSISHQMDDSLQSTAKISGAKAH